MNQRTETFVVLLRGINVGGKNKIGMAELKKQLEEAGFENVVTHSLAGNVILDSTLSAAALGTKIEKLLQANFKLDRELVMVVAIDRAAFRKIVAGAPKECGADNEAYRYYVLFLKDISTKEAMKDIEVREDVDMAWPGPSAIYYRLPSLRSGKATKSRLNKVTQKPLYQRITMRNWNTTTKILEILEKGAAAP